jgi:hypothetical protein
MIIDSPIISGSFAASGSLNQVGDITITGSLIVTGEIIGTASTATSASYALTASHATNVPQTASFADSATSASYAVTASYISGSGGGVGFPFSGSAVITGSLLITELSGSGIRYLTTDNDGLIVAQTASAAIKQTQAVTSTAGQTSFNITNGYTTGLVDVFINGTKLSAAEFTDTSGTVITLATGSNDGDTVEFVKYFPASGVTNNALRQQTTFIATAGQTVFSASYTPGLLDIFYNGSRLSTSDYTANNGTYFTLATGSVDGDILDVFVYSYQVGGFNGIGGAGVANQVAYFGTTNAITSSNVITISGNNAIITGSLLGTASNATTASFALTASSADNLLVRNTLTAQTLVVQTITSSVDFVTGSTRFGSLAANTHVFTGSMSVSGSLGIGTSSPVSSLHINEVSSSITLSKTVSALSSSVGALEWRNNHASTGVVWAKIDAVTLGTGANPWDFSNITFSTWNGFNSLTERMRITNLGYVGVGTNNPSSSLHINGSTYFGSRLMLERTSGAIGKYSIGVQNENNAFGITDEAQGNLTRFYINSSGNVGIGTSSPNTKLQVEDGFISTYHNINANGAGYGIQFYTNGGGSKNTIANISISQEGTARSGNIIFQTSNAGAPTERMRIKADGTVGISTTAPNATLHIGAALGGFNRLTQISVSTANTDAINLMASKNSGGSDQWWSWGVTTANAFYIVGDAGGPGGTGVKLNYNTTSWTSNSDIRIKDIIEPITDAVLKISTLNSIVYKFKNDETCQRRIGLIAQEVNEIFPEVVDVPEDQDSIWGVRYTELIPVLVKAIQEQQAQIEEQNTLITSLQTRIEQLENK